MSRQDMLDLLAERIVMLPGTHPQRVAVDGIDAAGKTTLANELASTIQARRRPVIRASIDGFHRPRAERHWRGPDSSEGYYRDSFDYPALREALLVPLGAAGSRRYRPAVFDYRTDRPLSVSETEAPDDAVLLMDGVFLLRPELNDLWDYRIFVAVPFDVAMERAVLRDTMVFGSTEMVEVRYRQRYCPGQQLYFAEADPHKRADAIVENSNPVNPALTFRGSRYDTRQ
jgi:uridine kinase